MADDEPGVSRRGLLAAGAGAAVGGGAGVLYFGGWLDGGGGSTQVEAQEPNADGQATLGELRYLLESWDGRPTTLDVTDFTYEDGVVDVAYRSAAEDQSGYQRWRTHLTEVGHVLWSYAQYVDNNDADLSWPPGSGGGDGGTTAPGTEGTASGTTRGGPTAVARETVPEDGRRALRILATVENPYSVPDDSDTPDQGSSYGVERQWIANWLAGAWTEQALINRVVQTRVGTVPPDG